MQIPSSEYKTEFQQAGPKAAISATGAKADGGYVMVPIDQLVVPDGFNVRIHDAAYQKRIEDIAESIIQNGFYKHMPLSGYAAKEGSNNFIYVTGGFTRLAAAKLAIECGAPIEAIPVVLKPAGTSMADLTLALAIDNTGAPLKPYERGIVIKRLTSYGWPAEQIAKKMNVTPSYVNGLLYLHGLPQALQDMVTADKVSAGRAVELARQHGANEALKLISEAEQTVAGETPEGQEVDSGSSSGKRPRRIPVAGTVTKRVALSAIDYAINLPGDGLEFLQRWRTGDKDAVAEVEATLKKPEKPAKAVKGTAKPAKAKDATPPAAAKPARKTKEQKAAEVKAAQDAAATEMGKAADRLKRTELKLLEEVLDL